jgi:hypothetical protein
MAIPHHSCSVKNGCFASSISYFCNLWPGAAIFPWDYIMTLLQSPDHYDAPHRPRDAQSYPIPLFRGCFPRTDKPREGA